MESITSWVLRVSRSGFHGWAADKLPGTRKRGDQALLAAICPAHEGGRGVYEPKKIQEELAGQGIKSGLNRIKRLRRQVGIRCKQKCKFEATPTAATICP